MSRLDEIKARANAALPGPWRWADWGTTFGRTETDNWQERRTLEAHPGGDAPRIHARKDVAISLLTVDEFTGTADDATFIVHAREDIPWLLAEVKRLQKEIDEQTYY